MSAKEKYIEAVGRRKTATARVRITPAKKTSVVVNGKKLEVYFPIKAHQALALESIGEHTLEVTVLTSGGGVSSQAESIRHGIARALIKKDVSLRGDLKKAGFLTRDQRSVERKKFGLKKARRAPQFSKR